MNQSRKVVCVWKLTEGSSMGDESSQIVLTVPLMMPTTKATAGEEFAPDIA